MIFLSRGFPNLRHLATQTYFNRNSQELNMIISKTEKDLKKLQSPLDTAAPGKLSHSGSIDGIFDESLSVESSAAAITATKIKSPASATVGFDDTPVAPLVLPPPSQVAISHDQKIIIPQPSTYTATKSSPVVDEERDLVSDIQEEIIVEIDGEGSENNSSSSISSIAIHGKSISEPDHGPPINSASTTAHPKITTPPVKDELSYEADFTDQDSVLSGALPPPAPSQPETGSLKQISPPKADEEIEEEIIQEDISGDMDESAERELDSSKMLELPITPLGGLAASPSPPLPSNNLPVSMTAISLPVSLFVQEAAVSDKSVSETGKHAATVRATTSGEEDPQFLVDEEVIEEELPDYISDFDDDDSDDREVDVESKELSKSLSAGVANNATTISAAASSVEIPLLLTNDTPPPPRLEIDTSSKSVPTPAAAADYDDADDYESFKTPEPLLTSPVSDPTGVGITIVEPPISSGGIYSYENTPSASGPPILPPQPHSELSSSSSSSLFEEKGSRRRSETYEIVSMEEKEDAFMQQQPQQPHQQTEKLADLVTETIWIESLQQAVTGKILIDVEP